MYVTSFFSLLSVVYLLDSAGRLIGVNRRCMDAVVITYLTDGFPHVSYSTDLSFYFTPHAGLGYDMNNIRIKLLKLFVTHGVSQIGCLRSSVSWWSVSLSVPDGVSQVDWVPTDAILLIRAPDCYPVVVDWWKIR